MDDIIERALRGEATAAELKQLAAWRAQSPEHERQYQALIRLLAAARTLGGELAGASIPPTAAELLSRARDAAVAKHARRGTAWRWVAPAVAAAAVLLLVIDLVHPVLGRRGGAAAYPAEIVTGTSELATVTLGDGSVVRLAPSTRLRLAQGGDPRAVRLDGRAFFAIAKAPDHPFHVYTRSAQATVLGTRFEIATRKHDLRLVVVEGRVALDAGANRVEVRGGEASAVANGTASPPVRLGDPDSLVTWVGKFLVFQSTPLSEVAKELERMYGVDITIESPLLASRTITATFTDQSLAQVLDVVCSISNARCETRDGAVMVSRP